MMAAIVASSRGKRVALIERNSVPGRKLLATGNGRCNLTNASVTLDRFHGGSPELIERVLARFDQPATLEFFAELGLVTKTEPDGRIFPRTNQASSVVEVMRQRLVRDGVDILLDSQVAGIERSRDWKVSIANGQEVHSDKLIIATGGRAANVFGSTGDGLYWATKLGHTLTPMHAALVPLETVETWPAEVAGTKLEAATWSTSHGKRIAENTGDVLFTSYGVSGPAVMALARTAAPLLSDAQVEIHIDIFPDLTESDLDRTLLRIFESDSRKTVAEALVGLLPSGLIPVVARLADLPESECVGIISKSKRQRIVSLLKDIPLTIKKLRPSKEAQVTAGGIESSEIDPETLESKLIPTLYFAGEALDVDGDSGGFNLQWAWSSGYVAGLVGDR
jgi:predicted Rossmann fold flavoprotein